MTEGDSIPGTTGSFNIWKSIPVRTVFKKTEEEKKKNMWSSQKTKKSNLAKLSTLYDKKYLTS